VIDYLLLVIDDFGIWGFFLWGGAPGRRPGLSDADGATCVGGVAFIGVCGLNLWLYNADIVIG